MKSDLVPFYRIHRNIFGVCRNHGTLFRLSDSNVYLRTKPKRDWMDEIDEETSRLETLEERLDTQQGELRDVARRKGRALAMAAIRKLDLVFGPRKLNPDDAKVLFHPVDYVVFRGMTSGDTKNIVLLDRASSNEDRLALQHSIGRVIEKGDYEWLTIRIDDQGNVCEQK